MLCKVLLGAVLAVGSLLLASQTPAPAQLVGEAERNVSQMADYQNECAIAINPNNQNELFVACNTAGPGLFFARSTDRGNSWTYPDPDRTLADGDNHVLASGETVPIPIACCDPSLAWDGFGNLFVSYAGNLSGMAVLVSTDSGQTFRVLQQFPGSIDQPTVTAQKFSNGTGAVWVVWSMSSKMRAAGAKVNGLGMIDPFGPIQTVPGTNSCSFGDVAIAPDGTKVVQVCEAPRGKHIEEKGKLLVNIDTDGLGSGNFGSPMPAIETEVGQSDSIPAQSSNGVDAEPGLAYDRNPASPRFGRLYLVYTDEVGNESNDTDIMVRYSDDDGQNWSAPIRVNDDPALPVRSQFLPRIAANPSSGNIAVCWHDARNSPTNDQMQEFCSMATPTAAVPSFFSNSQVGAGTSSGSGSNPPTGGDLLDAQYGDYSGLDYFQGRVHPVWADQSNVTGDNPDGTTKWEAESNRVSGGAMASEGDPHVKTVDGIHYDFQAAGDFVAIRAANGFEVQTRHRAIPTSFLPGPDRHTGLATCVSLISAVAARVGNHRVSFQGRSDDSTGPAEMEVRIDGKAVQLSDGSVMLPGGGEVMRSAVDGLEIAFPNGALLTATPGFWPSQNAWYINLNITGADAYEGIMGALPVKSWVPALPDGTSVGGKPASHAERYTLLYRQFAEAWRVAEKNSLFDSPAVAGSQWPNDAPPCAVDDQKPLPPVSESAAQQACRGLLDDERRQNCVFDVAVTGETGFAETYRRTERLERFGTITMLSPQSPDQNGSPAPSFTATAVPRWQPSSEPPEGSLQFYVDGKPAGEPQPLDRSGRVSWAPKDLPQGGQKVSARFLPAQDSAYLTSLSEAVGTPNR